jgi:hypothetical protein
MEGLSNHPLLQPAIVTKVVDSIQIDAEQYPLSTEVPFVTQEGNKVVIDVRQRMGGMTMAVAPGAESPIIEKRGVQQDQFSPASFREKVLLGEKDILNLRKLGTASELQTAQETVTDILGQLRYRVENRIEWCKWSALMGSLSVAQKDVQFTIDYGIPAFMKPALTGGDRWDQVTGKPLTNILDWLELFDQESPDAWYMTYNGHMEMLLLKNTEIRTLRDALFTGQNDPAMLTRGNIQQVFNAYAGLPIRVNTKGYWLVAGTLAALAPAATSIAVDDATGFATGDIVTIVHKDGSRLGHIRVTLTSVTGNSLGFGALPGAVTYPMGSEIRVKKPFIPNDKFIIRGQLPPGTTGGTNFMEFISTNHVYGPGGLMAPVPGIFSKFLNKENDDPPSLQMLMGVTGLPVLYWPTANVVATTI